MFAYPFPDALQFFTLVATLALALKISLCSQEHLETDLDSSEASTENGRSSRFPKPQVEIQLTPLQPDKMEIKQHGSMSPARVKMPETRKKRKSDDMDEV